MSDTELLKQVDETIREIAPRVIPREVLEVAAEERLSKLALELMRHERKEAAFDVLQFATELTFPTSLRRALVRCATAMQTSMGDSQIWLHQAAAEAALRVDALIAHDEYFGRGSK